MTSQTDADRRYMSRKFWFAVAMFLASLGLFLFHYVNADLWASLTKWVVGMYLGANVVDQVFTRYKLTQTEETTGDNK